MKVPKLSLTVQIFFGMISGIVLGLFFGEKCGVLEPFGTAYIKLMQVSALPFIVTSIIANIGSFSKSDASHIAKKGSLVLLMIWAIGTLAFFSMQLVFPVVPTATFYIPDDQIHSSGIDMINIFIPSNIFHSLSEEDIPAIVLFSILFAFILIGDNKSIPFVNSLKGLSSAFSRLNNLLSRISPLGVFFIMANLTGTITLDRFLQVQIFVFTLVVLSILLIFLVLPLLAFCFTPFTYRKILFTSSEAIFLGFSTGNTFIALPLISEGILELFRINGIKEKNCQEEKVQSSSEILIPMAYVFPNLGLFVPFLFILFTAWFYNNSLGIVGQLTLLLVGIPSFFSTSSITIPFLLNILHLPSEAFDLYIGSDIIRNNFVAPLSSMSIFTFTAICTSLLTDSFHLRLKKMLPAIFIVILVFAAVIIGLEFGFTHLLANTYHGDEIVGRMDLPKQESWMVINHSLNIKVYKTQEDLPNDLTNDVAAVCTLHQINQRHTLKVGYNPDTIPFVFFNKNGSLVGYDVEMAYDLAQFMGVRNLEFVPISYGSLAESLNRGTCDLVMATVSVTPRRLEEMKFTKPYMTLHLSVIVRDYRKEEFMSLEAIQEMKGLKIAAVKGTVFENLSAQLFPQATLVKLNNTEEFFSGDKADALLITAEEGSVMTILHPFYDVAIFQPDYSYKILLAYPIAINGDDEFLRLLNYWLDVESAYGGLDEKYDYWILGKQVQKAAPRWSVARNILHWWS